MIKITHTSWFTNSQGTTGIVRVQTEDEGIKYYIGRAVGMNADQDASYIAEYGASFPKCAGDALFGITVTGTHIGYITKDVEGSMPWTKLNGDAAKVELGRHPIYLGAS